MRTQSINTTILAEILEVPVSSNLTSVMMGLHAAGRKTGLTKPHRLAMYLAQISHESAGFRYDGEVWGPTPAQLRYEGRADLGNTEPGDGFNFRGRTAMQITGRENTKEFMGWCQKVVGASPNFLLDPDLMNTDPWEGLGPIWYWATRDLNTWADLGDFANVTRKINGGTNGYTDRCRRFSDISLALLGYEPHHLKFFQDKAGLKADGVSGPKTRAAMVMALKQLPDIDFMPATVTSKAPENIQISDGSAIGRSATVIGAVLSAAAVAAFAYFSNLFK